MCAQSPVGQLSGELSHHLVSVVNQRTSPCHLTLNDLTGVNRTAQARLPGTRSATVRLLAACAKTGQGGATPDSSFRIAATINLDTPLETPSGFPNQGDGRWDLRSTMATSVNAATTFQVAPAEPAAIRYDASLKIDHRLQGGTAPLYCDSKQASTAGLSAGANTSLSQAASCADAGLRGAGTTISGEGSVTTLVTLRLAGTNGLDVWEPVVEITSVYNFQSPRLALDPVSALRVLAQAGSSDPGEAQVRIVNQGREQMDWRVVVPPEAEFTPNLTSPRQPGERIVVEAVPSTGQPIAKGQASLVTLKVNASEAKTTGNWKFDLRVESLNGGNKTLPVQVDIEPFQGLDELRIDAGTLTPAAGELTVKAAQAFHARVHYTFRSRAEADLSLRLFDDQGVLLRASAPLRVQRGDALQFADFDIPAFALPEQSGGLVLRAVLMDVPAGTAQARLLKQSTDIRYTLSADLPDLTISRLETVQVVQDEAQSIPMIAGKKTAVRVFVKQDRDIDSGMQARVTLEAFRGGQALAGSPLASTGTVAARGTHDRANKTHSLNFILPEEWTSLGEIELVAKLEGPADRTERNTANNTERRTVRFVEIEGAPKPWVIEYFRVCYGPAGQSTAASDGQVGTLDEYLRKLFPVAARDLRYRPFRAPCAVWSSEITDENYSQFTAWVRKFYEAIHPAQNAPSQLAGWFDQFRIGLAGVPDPSWTETGSVTWQLHDRSLGRLYNAHTLANQIARNLGRRLPNTEDACGARDNGTDWRAGESLERRSTAKTLDVGFDPETGEAKSGDKFDLMSFCASGDSIWISPFTYRKLIESRLLARPGATAPRAADAAAEHLIISGTVARDGSSGRLDPGYRVPSGGRAIEAAASGNHVLRISGEAEVLAEHKFNLRFQHARDNRNIPAESFTLRVPFPPGAKRVVLLRGETELASLQVDGTVPQVAITAPQAGARWEGGGERTLAWSATHAGGKELTYMVLYSADGGQGWTPLAVDIKRNELRFNSAEITGGANVHFRVLATSGLETGEATVGPIEVAQTPRMEAGPADLNFRKVVLGEPKVLTLTLRSTGSGPLEIRRVRTDTPAYRVAEGPGAEIPAGSERSVAIEFRPTVEGSQAGTLIVETNHPAVPELRIPLLGSGVRTAESDVEIGPLSLDFGTVDVGQTRSLEITVRNYGPGVLSVTNALITNSRFSIADPAVPSQVPVNGERRAVVQWAPNAAGEANAELRISTNDPQLPLVVVALRGTGRAITLPPPPGENPVPLLTRITPGSTVAGGPAFQITLAGSNFRQGSSGEWNGQPRATSFLSATELRMTVDAADIASSGTANISVFTPPPGGGRSLSLGFRIDAPAPPPPPVGPSILIQQFKLTACPDVTAYVSVLDAAGVSDFAPHRRQLELYR